jgi:hypothetical protein
MTAKSAQVKRCYRSAAAGFGRFDLDLGVGDAALPLLVRRIMLFSPGCSFNKIFKAHHQGSCRSAGKEWLRRVPLRTTWKPLLAESK